MKKAKIKKELHYWDFWKTIVNKPIGFSYWIIVQERVCLKCNLKEIKKEVI